jgi:hypothetical protein
MAEARDDSFFLILLSDVGAALARHESADNQATRRDLIRTAFAAIEGLVWIFREQVVTAAEETYGLEDGEREVLQERQLSVSEQGKISAQSRFLGLIPTVRLVARIASRINGAAHCDFGSSQWDDFRKAIAIRNRITHPKSAEDLHLSKADVDQVTNALFWFLEMHTRVVGATIATRKKYLGEFRDVLAKLQLGDAEVTALYQALRHLDD